MRIGFIGAGNMASAIMEGMLRGGVAKDQLIATDVSEARRDYMRTLGISVASDIEGVAKQADVIVLAIKPAQVPAVADALQKCSQIPDVLSIVVSLSQKALEGMLPGARGIARAMPNTPACVGEGVIAFCDNHSMDAARFEAMVQAFDACGKTCVVPEHLIGAVTAISGSGPAYVYLFIEALADAGVREGLPREMAYTLASQTVLGAGHMVRDTGMHPAALKDAVCSPGGTTIEAVYALEKAGLRNAVMDAVDACARKADGMGKGNG